MYQSETKTSPKSEKQPKTQTKKFAAKIQLLFYPYKKIKYHKIKAKNKGNKNLVFSHFPR